MPETLGVLILGSLGPNQDRILSLAERVDRVVYAYTEFHPNVLRLEPFVVCVPLARRNPVPQLRYLLAAYGLTVIYSLLNAMDLSTEATLEALEADLGIPIVRHYKEHPCDPTREEKRVLLETQAQIYINDESLEYFRRTYDVPIERAHVFDADMLSSRHMVDEFGEKWSVRDREPHLLVAGALSINGDRADVRDLCSVMSQRKVHVHLYGYVVGSGDGGGPVIGDARAKRLYLDLADQSPYLHLEEYIQPAAFCRTWSRFDAAFMHATLPRLGSHQKSSATFDELNLPHRYSAYLAAGLPLAVCRTGQTAMRSLTEREGFGLVYETYDDLADQLLDRDMVEARALVARRKRVAFCFESIIPRLIDVFRRASASLP